jgi:Double zinc ribbon
MLPFAYFGIESSGLNLVVDLLILFVVVLYLSLIYWTYTDARRRILDPMLVGCSTAASLFPFVGTIVYMILRPPEYLEDVHERELEMQAAEARLHELDSGLCPHCDYRIERDFIRCPSCLRKLKERCVSCSRPLDPAWTMCPYCETEVPGNSSARRARRRRTTAAEGEEAEIGGSDVGVARHGGHTAHGARSAGTAGSQRTGSEPLGGGPLSQADRAELGEQAGGEQDEGVPAAPAAASKPAAGPRAGRAGRPGGRPRPSS